MQRFARQPRSRFLQTGTTFPKLAACREEFGGFLGTFQSHILSGADPHHDLFADCSGRCRVHVGILYDFRVRYGGLCPEELQVRDPLRKLGLSKVEVTDSKTSRDG